MTPYELLRHTGDIGYVKTYMPYLEKYCEYIEGKKDEDGFVEFGLGDWNAPKACEVKAAPLKLIASLYYVFMNDAMVHFCQALGMDASRYKLRTEEMRARIREAFVKKN
jgi:alpha-L-rhamnosidase